MSGVFAARIGAGGVTGAPAAGGTARMLCLADGDVPERTAALAFERDGERALPALGGRFALLLWDRARAAGVLARDPLGHRSVFYTRAGADLLVASELRALLELLPSTPGPDEVSVAHWLAGTGVPVGRTLYAGVRRLPPGSLLRVGEDEPQRWWSPAPGEGPSEAQAPEFLRTAMASAVERALAGAERPAVLLSGGFDSGSIAALAGAPATYSGVFPDHPGVDESAAIAATTAHVGAHGSERRFEDASALAACAEFLLEHHVPPASPNGFVWRPLIRGAAADGITRMLDGEGGDELFGCAPFLIADALRAGRPDRALALARSLPGMGPRPRRSWVAQAL
ncbi:MAG TPA: asparagine synthase-related protein, partial [Solirubrobacteraceae bacterium]|nr:asparagine synthase-related protein [Solirubrobacteraceae bacterium]